MPLDTLITLIFCSPVIGAVLSFLFLWKFIPWAWYWLVRI